jgi:hypothetical protein
MTKVPLASLDSFLDERDSESVKDYPFRWTFDEVKEKTSTILHTSGSTGIPKPVYVSHGVFASQDAQQMIPYEGGKPTWVDLVRGQRVFIGLPLFHAACLTQLGLSVFVDDYVIVLPPAGPMNVDVVDGVFTHGNVTGALIAPSLIVDVYKTQEILANMVQRLRFLAYVGGTVSKAIGDDLCSKLHLITNFGSTETLSPPLEVLDDRRDWEYLSYSPCYGYEMRPVGDGLRELVIVRDPSYAQYQGVFSTFPKLKEYSTSDLYEPHPSKEGLWRFKMRNDDIICFNNAEKLNPITMEATITGHPKVQSVVIGGHGQFQSCLLLEPKVFPRTTDEAARLLDDVWRAVKDANKDCPAHGRLMRNFIMLSDPERPLPRAGKDTVQRSAVFTLYAREFLAIYNVPDGEDPLFVSTGGKLPAAVPDADAEATSAKSSARAASTASLITTALTGETRQVNGDSLIPVSQIEAYVEGYLRQQLPEMVREFLNQSLGSVMSQMATSLLTGSSLSMDNGHAQGYTNDHTNSHTNSDTNGDTNGHTNGHTNDNVEASLDVNEADKRPELDTQDVESFKAFLTYIILDATYVGGITNDANMFTCGLDSVQVPELVKAINKALGEHSGELARINAKLIYSNPTVSKLAEKLFQAVNNTAEPELA